jgi:hypothetical protein
MRAGVAPACARLADQLERTAADPVTCEVGGLGDPTLPAVDVLARLALAVRRQRRSLRLEHASPEILELLALCGLADVLGRSGHAPRRSGGEALRKPEEREEPSGVEEERDAGDPVAVELEDLE